MKRIIIVVFAAILFSGGVLAIGVINHAHASAPINLTFSCNDKDRSYEDIDLEVYSSLTGLGVKEELISAIGEDIEPGELFLLCKTDEPGVYDQVYDTEAISDYVQDGDTVYYVISPISNGATYAKKYYFECIAYDQYNDQYYYTLTPR